LNLEIVEKFFTVSGEAPQPGKPIYLVRFAGCNLDCVYCDTEYRNEVNFTYTIDELIADIANAVKAYPAAEILFTGGEPLIGERQSALEKIYEHFSEKNFYIETNGSIPITGFCHANAHYVVDWKTDSSGCGDRFCTDNLEKMRAGHDCIKIVVSSADLVTLTEKIDLIKNTNRGIEIYLSPQWGKIAFDELAAFIIDNRLDASISLQLHKIIWGNKRGV
jgi:7-carboxy-7-deazaguanine synthase